MASTLTQRRVEKITPGDARREIPDGGQTGLYLVVQAAPSSAKSWAVRYRHHGRPRKATLGAFPAIDLTQARKLAQAALRAASEGEDPAGEKVARRTASTIDALWIEYRDLHMARKSKATAAAAATLFTNDVLPAWGKRSAESIRRRDVMTLLDGMTDEPAKWTKAKVRLHHFFDWCIEREIIEASPVAKIKQPHKNVKRDRVLTDDELRAVWLACDKVGTFQRGHGPHHDFDDGAPDRSRGNAVGRTVGIAFGRLTEAVRRTAARWISIVPQQLNVVFDSVPCIVRDGAESPFVFEGRFDAITGP